MTIDIELPLNPAYVEWIQSYISLIDPDWQLQKRRGYQGEDEDMGPILDAEFTQLQKNEKSLFLTWIEKIPTDSDPIHFTSQEFKLIAVCRAITSLRLWIRENRLQKLSDAKLESGLLLETDEVSQEESIDWNAFQILAFIQEALITALA